MTGNANLIPVTCRQVVQNQLQTVRIQVTLDLARMEHVSKYELDCIESGLSSEIELDEVGSRDPLERKSKLVERGVGLLGRNYR